MRAAIRCRWPGYFIPLGALYFETNDLEQAEYHLTTGIALCEQMGTVYYTLVGQRTLAKLYYARGKIGAAWETLAAARQLAASLKTSGAFARSTL